MEKNIIEAMNWRRAINKFDTTKKLSESQIFALTEVLRLTPSSYGLQPWTFIVVTNPDIRMMLQQAGYNQAKISESSHLVVFAVKKNIDAVLADEFIQSVADTQGVTVEDLKGYADGLKGAIAGRGGLDGAREWATRQVYIALGVLIASASVLGIDSAPMEGFDSKKFDEILGLSEKGLESRVICGLGFRASDDPISAKAKVRFPREKVIIEMK